MLWKRLKQGLSDFLGSSVRERQRILWLLPLLAAACLLFAWQDKPRFERSFTLYSDAVSEGSSGDNTASSPRAFPAAASSPSRATAFPKKQPNKHKEQPNKHTLFTFDPNTIDRDGLVQLGFSPKQAQVILNYRESGAVFHRPGDFARCYTVSEEKYAELAPYIRITEAYRTPPGEKRNSRPETAGFPNGQTEKTLARDGIENRPEAEASPFPNAKPSLDTEPSPNAPPVPTELNSADSASLVALRGIGPLSAGRILRYRQRLGGFVRADQLREVQGILDENYLLILQQIFVDSSKIQKIDINFATPERMGRHPYLPPRTLDKILKNRQLKGGWSSTRELVEQHILSGEQAERLAPYLCFGAR